MNKIKIGDRVQLKTKTHTWHAKHINDVYLRYTQSEFDKENFEEIACLLGSKARRTKLKGTAIGYGATDDDFKNKRNYVRVKFNWKGLTVEFYCSELDLKRL